MKRADSAVDPTVALKCELAAEVLRSFGKLRFAATGWSMLPSVWPGETLVVERASNDRVRLGDIVLVDRGQRLRAHRVIAKAGDSANPQWITQGDALPTPDNPVSKSELLGRVAYVIRRGKLTALDAELSAGGKLIAKIVRRSTSAARALVYLTFMRRRLGQTSEKSVLPCQV